MGLNCRHCGTRYAEFSGHDGFCCSGCAQVYALIQAEGMGDYYALQDRVGKPPAVDLDQLGSLSWARELQAVAEQGSRPPSVRLSLHGMTCVGCAWLVEKVSRGQAGVQSVHVDLEANQLVLTWDPGAFSLPDLVVELHRFGYGASAFEGTQNSSMSPLLWRICLCALFAVNGVLLAAFSSFASEASDYSALIQLLEWFVAGLAALVGATFFILPTYQSLRRSRLHYDALPSLGLLIAYVGAVLGCGDFELWHVSALVTALLLIRWVHRWQWSRVALPAGDVDATVIVVLQVTTAVILLMGASSLFTHNVQVAVAVLFAGSLHSLACCVSHKPSVGFVLISVLCPLVGVVLGYLSGSILLALLYLVATGAISHFLFFRYSAFCSRH